MSTDASTHDTPTPSGAVVAALDGSHRDDAVTAWAVAEAAALSAPLHLVHAVDLGTPLSAYGELLTSPEIVERVEQESTKVVVAAAARVRSESPDLAVTTALPTGSPTGALLAAAEGARVLVVGSARKNRAERIVLGTTSLSVVAHAPCAVVLVPEDVGTKGDGRVVVGIDGSQHSRLAFDYALDASLVRGRAVTTVTSWNVEVENGVISWQGRSLGQTPQENGRWQMFMRPHDLQVVDEETALSGRVAISRRAGRSRFAEFDIETTGQRIEVELSPELEARPGDVIHVQPKRWMLYPAT